MYMLGGDYPGWLGPFLRVSPVHRLGGDQHIHPDPNILQIKQYITYNIDCILDLNVHTRRKISGLVRAFSPGVFGAQARG